MKFSTHMTIFRWQPAALLRVSGADAATFLQGQFTNDLRTLPANAATYGLWLNVKGKVIADSFVSPGPAAGEFWIISYFSPAAVIRERLESFVIADDVVIEDATAAWSAVSVFGEGAGVVFAAEPRTGFGFCGRRTGGETECMEWLFPIGERDAVKAQLAGLTELSVEEVARRRIKAGIPAVPADVGPGDLPNEGGLEVEAISYTKGCYLGQEVMARLKTMGQVRRRLMRVTAPQGNIPSLPAPLFLGERQVGELRSMVSDGAGEIVGLAMVSLVHVAPGALLGFAPAAAANVRITDAR